LKKVRLLGGPFDGEEVEIEDEQQEILIPFVKAEKHPNYPVKCEMEEAKFWGFYKPRISEEFYCLEICEK